MNKQIAINTFFLYGRTVVTALITFFSTRIVLQNLGVIDFGIYNVVAGSIAMLTFLNDAVSQASQRYFNIEMGRGRSLNGVFNLAIFSHLIIAIIVAIMMLLLEGPIISNVLTIPTDKLEASKTLYRIMCVLAFMNIITNPFESMIRTFQKMKIIAITGITEAGSRLLIAISLAYFSRDERLVVYSSGVAIFMVLSKIGMSYWSLKISKVCLSFKYLKDVKYKSEYMNFALLNIVGGVTYLAKSQGMAVLLNSFMGVVINAAYAIANTVAMQLLNLSQAFIGAINPQIIQAYGEGEFEKVEKLSIDSCRIGIALMMLIVYPVINILDSLLLLWLKNVPENTILLTYMILLATFANQLTVGLEPAIKAVGKIGKFILYAGTVKLAILPFAYLVLRNEGSLKFVFILYSLLELLSGLVRLWFLKNKINLKYGVFIKEVVVKAIVSILILSILSLAMTQIDAVAYRFFVSIILGFTVIGLTMIKTSELSMIKLKLYEIFGR